MELRLQKFCCCCTTRTGTLVIGTIGWIFTLIQMFGLMDPNYEAREQQRTKMYVDKLNINQNSLDTEEDSSWQKALDSGNNIYFKIGYGVVTFIICLLLIWGVYKKDKRFILPWLVLKGFEASLLVIAIVIFFIAACVIGHGLLFLLLFFFIFLTVLTWYFWLCVWSHYKDLGNEETSGTLPVYYTSTNVAPPEYTEKSQHAVP